MSSPKSLTILGATGSVGRATLDVVQEANDRARQAGKEPVFEIISLTAHSDWVLLAALAIKSGARHVALSDSRYGDQLKAALADHRIAIDLGPQALIEAAARPSDLVMAAIVGAAGLAPTLAAARRGATIALANKECLVCAGGVFLQAVAQGGGAILPVDSEHNAIFQVLDQSDQVEKLILTASGGPFRTWSASAIAAATPEQAINHPNWSMGQKISVDSATLMNKGLELIEAALLFAMPEHQIDILVHPQSVIHSLVAYQDGSVLAQLGAADMRIPIAHTLAWPARLVTSAPRLDLTIIGRLEFEVPDLDRFPALKLARAALKKNGAAPTILNAANEIAVQSFLHRSISFPQIAAIVSETMDEACRLGLDAALGDLDDVYAADQAGRSIATQYRDKRRFVSV
ncbi:1-deoxy-D-xylulose-5-phosphate reductoisomerase [Candidatus Phycosocius spiralis]|uniref:1-deoxy-D-xylulose 5-phosphate reductoisomerase n=1 Tax=Candidatus Phycosocius spiralis TaxID=2815099 RepID=A0ABQ4PT12_9PROT|nr:1-deoxy-D-xylulose-5-phosphate reductoisomerase [Candidatus Phycosocius spiralis]GIU66121.1 1-deoxy-D-xylulose 5-phosphate reductoisomerase [Candidatus Phycosocius spiralis]